MYIQLFEFKEYSINEYGNIISSTGKEITGTLTSEGRRIIRLRNRDYRVAWLVMKYHGGIVANKNETIKHKDDDFMNCHIDNLLVEKKHGKVFEPSERVKVDTWMNGTSEIYC